MLRFAGTITVVLTTLFTARAQFKDSVKYYLTRKKPELIGGLTSRNTFIGSTRTSVSGITAGFSWGGKLRSTAGIFWLTKPYEERRIIHSFTPAAYPVDEVSRFWYLGLTANYVFLRKNHWAFDIPVRVGIGSARVKEFDVPGGNKIKENRSVVIPLETGVNAQYNIAWWIGLNAGIGNRIVLGKNRVQRFSGTYYNLGVLVFLGDIYQYIRKDMKNNPGRK